MTRSNVIDLIVISLYHFMFIKVILWSNNLGEDFVRTKCPLRRSIKYDNFGTKVFYFINYSVFLFSVKFTKIPLPASTQSSEKSFSLRTCLSVKSSFPSFSVLTLSVLTLLHLLSPIAFSMSDTWSGRILFSVSGKIRTNTPETRHNVPTTNNSIGSDTCCL